MQWRESSSCHLTVIPAALPSFMDEGRRLLSAFSRTLAVYFCFFGAMFEQLFEILKGEAVRLLQPSAPPVAACYGRTSNPSSCLIQWSDVSCYFSYKTTFGGLFSCDVTKGKTRIWRLWVSSSLLMHLFIQGNKETTLLMSKITEWELIYYFINW